MIKREISAYLQHISSQYPVITVTGPRQSGKTTLVKNLFKNKPYINLEQIDEREFAQSDPRGFLNKIPDGAVLDEIQRAPDLLSYIQSIVDDKQINGMFILTGSQNFALLDSINQSLAGRTALLKLLPFSITEIAPYKITDICEIIVKGLYPRVYDQGLDPMRAYGDYFETYVERDLRQISSIKNLGHFRKFVRLCAGRCGQIVNTNSLSNDVGVSHTTIREWLTILDASYIIFLLEPFHSNINKRLIKSPKLFFYDTGLLCYLLGIEERSHFERHPLKGNIFENLIVSEILKFRFNSGKKNNLNFYRDSTGNEIDIIFNIADKVAAIEVKSSETVTQDFFKGFAAFDKVYADAILKRILVYGGKRSEIHNGVEVTNAFGLQGALNGIEK